MLPQTRPSPFFSVADEVCPQWIAFDVSNDTEHVAIRLHGDGFESPLIHCSSARAAAECVPTACMCACQPVQELRQVTVIVSEHHKMPMIRHQAVREQTNRDSRLGFTQQILERRVVRVGVEQASAFRTAIQRVKDHSLRVGARSSRHVDGANLLARTVPPRKESRPLFCLFWLAGDRTVTYTGQP